MNINKSYKKNISIKLVSKKTKIRSKNVDNFVKALKQILFETSNRNEIIQKIKALCIDSIDNIKYESYKQYFVPYGNFTGKSGAVVGYLSNNVNTVMKLNLMKKNELYGNSIAKNYKSDKCVFIDHKINEIIISIILQNIEYFVNINSFEKKLIKNHTVGIYDYGISEKGVFLTMPLVGFNYVNPDTKKNNYLTNFLDLMIYNHLPLLKIANSNNDIQIFELYDSLLFNNILKYTQVIKILQNHLKYINTDIKFSNIFIRYEKNKDSSLNHLRDKGFLIDFNLLLADLDKSIIEMNGTKILANPAIIHKLLKLINIGFSNNSRYSCNPNFSKVCKNISIYDFDILSIFIHLYAILLEYVPNIFNYLNKTNKLAMELLNLDENKFDILKKLLINGKYKLAKTFGVSFLLGEIIKKYCMLLNKL
jgi:hypothetical protein